MENCIKFMKKNWLIFFYLATKIMENEKKNKYAYKIFAIYELLLGKNKILKLYLLLKLKLSRSRDSTFI